MMFSLEDNEETVVENTNSPEQTAEESEVMVESDELAENNAAIDEANDNIAVMERLVIKMEEAVENGEGVDELTSGALDTTFEHIANRLGVEYSGYMVSTEQFGSSNTRLAATKISLEMMDGKLKEFKENLIKKVKEWWDKIRAFFSKLVSLIAVKQRTYKGLEEKFKSIKDKATENSSATFDNATLSSAFGDGTKGQPGKVTEFVKGAKGGLEHVADIVNNWEGKSAEQGLSSSKGGKTVEFIGGDTMVDDVETGTVYFVKNTTKKSNSSGKCLAMTKSQVQAALTDINDLLEWAHKFVSKEVDPVKASRKIMEEINYFVKEAEGNEKEKYVEDRKRIVAAANNIGAAANTAPKYAIRTAGLAMAYVSSSMSTWTVSKD